MAKSYRDAAGRVRESGSFALACWMAALEANDGNMEAIDVVMDTMTAKERTRRVQSGRFSAWESSFWKPWLLPETWSQQILSGKSTTSQTHISKIV